MLIANYTGNIPMRTRFLVSLPILLLASSLLAADPFAFNPNDRIVFIGDALVERDMEQNYLETMLAVRLHGKGITFRNIGWSGDTVWGEARAVFGVQKDGYAALLKMIGETKPTVAFLNYGMNESFAGSEGVERFDKQYNTLLDDLAKQAPGVRVVLVSPIAFQDTEAPGVPLDPKRNENLKLYTDAVRALAQKRNAQFIDEYAAFQPTKKAAQGPRLTSDGMHLTAAGYIQYANAIEQQLGLKPIAWNFAKTTGIYEPIGPVAVQQTSIENLRRLIAAKNLQFFNRWRPQNETYIFLFRKKEQGQNAKEIPQFDPIITAKEAEIAKLADEVAKSIGL